MELFMADLPFALFALALGVALVAGIIKGVVGFAMPMVLISGLSLFVPPDIALAGLILPTLVTNVMQVFRFSFGQILSVIHRFWAFLIVGGTALVSTAQFVPILDQSILLLVVGIPVAGFAVFQLVGGLRRHLSQSLTLDVICGALTGAIGGVSGIWGPTTATYLTAIRTPKADHILTQGVIYSSCAVLLFLAHVQSGVFSTNTAPFSLSLLPAAILGMKVGQRISDRIDQGTFRKVALIVLILCGVNLIIRGLTG